MTCLCEFSAYFQVDPTKSKAAVSQIFLCFELLQQTITQLRFKLAFLFDFAIKMTISNYFNRFVYKYLLLTEDLQS